MSMDDVLRGYPLYYHRTDIKLPPAKPIPSGTYTYEEFEQMINNGMLDGWYTVNIKFNGLESNTDETYFR